MERKYFGTDGVRGRTNEYPITAEMTLRLGAALGRFFRKDVNEHRVVIGKDTRRSGYMLENALTAGLTSTGMNVFLLGPIPTPAIGLLTQSMRADLGIMISASHNPYGDNGIKLFGPDGFKLSDQAELEIEALLSSGVEPSAAKNIGRVKRIDDGLGRYVERVKSTFPIGFRLDGIKIVIDCANGAAYRGAPEALWELGAEVIPIGISPNGFNINEGCGSTNLNAAIDTVITHQADLGICLDGDADRVILIDEKGLASDGDQLLALLATRWAKAGMLKNNTLVTTVMSNLGLERYLDGYGIDLIRTSVGDRYVVEEMRRGGHNLGGEQSGHIVMTDFATTGDGLIAALQFLAIAQREECRASDFTQLFTPLPQKLVNMIYTIESDPLDFSTVKIAISQAEELLKGKGRLLVRKSGTEPLLRIMGECDDQVLLDEVIHLVSDAVTQVK
ncbi:MAG: phosphoglucosamine mutase [Paracoccaceae bacterium]